MKNNYYKILFKRLFSSFSFLIPLIILSLLFIIGLFVFLNVDSSMFDINLSESFTSPSKKHIFGTNEYGQDFFTIVFIAIYNTLILAFIVSFVNIIIGCIIGIIWGNSPKIDSLMIVIKNVFDNIPSIFFYIIIIYSLGTNTLSLLVIIILFNWINTACLIRNNLLSLRNQDYNKVSKLMGTPFYKIALFNYLPSLLPIVFNSFAVSFPQIISVEITLSYFNLNLTNQEMSLGNILYSSISNNYCFSHPYLFIIPLVFLLIITLCFFFIGKAISTLSNKEVLSNDKN